MKSDISIVHKSPRRFRLFFIGFLFLIGVAITLYSAGQALKQSQDVRQQAATVCPMAMCPEGESPNLDDDCPCDPNPGIILPPESIATPAPSPDLVVASVRYDENEEAIFATIKNIGSAKSTSHQSGVYFYVNPADQPPQYDPYDSYHTPYAGSIPLYEIDPGANTGVELSVPLSNLVEGTNTIYVWVDRDGAINESDEGNNIASTTYEIAMIQPTPSLTPLLSDLFIDKIEVTPTNTVGVYNINVIAENQGENAGLHEIFFYVNESINPPSADIRESVPEHDWLFDGLASGDSENTSSVQQYSYTFTKENNVLYAWIDKDNAVAESNEDNNLLRVAFKAILPEPVVTVTPMPEITVTPHNVADICGPDGSRLPDSQVNQDDLNCILNDFYKTAPAGRLSTDLNKDGVVNLIDYAIFVYNYNKLNAQ